MRSTLLSIIYFNLNNYKILILKKYDKTPNENVCFYLKLINYYLIN